MNAWELCRIPGPVGFLPLPGNRRFLPLPLFPKPWVFVLVTGVFSAPLPKSTSAPPLEARDFFLPLLCCLFLQWLRGFGSHQRRIPASFCSPAVADHLLMPEPLTGPWFFWWCPFMPGVPTCSKSTFYPTFVPKNLLKF